MMLRYAKKLQRAFSSKQLPHRCSSQFSPLCLVASSENSHKNLTYTTLKKCLPEIVRNVDGSTLEFEMTADQHVIVYTDGSCLYNNTKTLDNRKSGVGVFWGNDDHPLNVSLPHGGTRLTNNRAEIAAAHAAILIARAFNIERLRLYTDSKNLVNACKYWLPHWQMNKWRLKRSDKPVANRDMWKMLADDMLYVLVDFHHTGDDVEGIKKAHKLANKGAKASAPSPLNDFL